MKRLLVTTTTLPRWNNDNTPSFVQDLSLRLSNNYKVIILAPHYIGSKHKQKIKKLNIIRYRYFIPLSQQNIVYDGGGVNKINRSLFYLLKLISLVISQAFTTFRYSLVSDYINAHWIIPQGLIAVLVGSVTNKKVVITVHGSDIHSLNNSFLVWTKKLALKKADMVIVNSSYTEELCQNLCKRKYHIIPMGINIPHNASIEKSTSNNFNSNNRPIRIIFVGRIIRDKGVYDLLEALADLSHRGINYRATIVGDGPDLESIKKFAQVNMIKLNINFTGWVSQDDLPKHYYSADVFVGPSLKESQGLVFAEAAACALPLIGTNVGGIKDIIVDGYNGILVKPQSSSSIVGAISKLNKDRNLLHEMSKNSQKFVSDKYSWDKVAKEYINVFNAI